MSDDEPDLIERIENTWKNWHDDEWHPEKTVQQFQLYGPGKRAEALDQFDAELHGSISGSDLRRHAELHKLRATLDTVHHELRKVGR